MPRGVWATPTLARLARFGARPLIERCHAPPVGLPYRRKRPCLVQVER